MSFHNYSFSLQLVCVDMQEENSIWIQQGSSSASLVAGHTQWPEALGLTAKGWGFLFE